MKEKHHNRIPDSHKKRAKQDSQNNKIIGLSNNSSVFSYSPTKVPQNYDTNYSKPNNLGQISATSNQSETNQNLLKLNQNPTNYASNPNLGLALVENKKPFIQTPQNKTPRDLENILITIEHDNTTPRQINEFQPLNDIRQSIAN